MLKNWLVWFSVACITALTLSACNSPSYNQAEANVADVKIKASEARKKSDASAKNKPALLVKQGPYVDTSPISLQKNPSWLKNHIVIRGDQLPFSYYSRTIVNGAGPNILTKYQAGLDPSSNVTMNYSGSIKGALDLIASKTGYVYSIQDNTIYWQAFVTKTFDVAFMPGGTDYLMGKTGGGSSSTQSGGGSSGGVVSNYSTSDDSDSEFSNLKGTLSVWKDLDSTIKEMLSPEGKVIVSESTTSVTVRDRPSNVALVSQYIANMNTNLSKQVLVKIQVLEVNLEDDYNFGINWGLLMRAFNRSPFRLNASYGTPISITSITGLTGSAARFGTDSSLSTANAGGTTQNSIGGVPSYTILMNALNQQGKTSLVSEPRVVCMNNQVSVIRIVKQQGYLASLQNTALSGSSSSGSTPTSTVTSQLTPGTITTGLTVYVLPKILNDKIYMQVNADLSSAGQLTVIGSNGSNDPASAESNSNASFIQIPNVTIKHFNQRSMIRSGDTLILSGLRQVSNQTGAEQFLKSQALGGKSSQQYNTETIILITPIILPGSA